MNSSHFHIKKESKFLKNNDFSVSIAQLISVLCVFLKAIRANVYLKYTIKLAERKRQNTQKHKYSDSVLKLCQQLDAIAKFFAELKNENNLIEESNLNFK